MWYRILNIHFYDVILNFERSLLWCDTDFWTFTFMMWYWILNINFYDVMPNFEQTVRERWTWDGGRGWGWVGFGVWRQPLWILRSVPFLRWVSIERQFQKLVIWHCQHLYAVNKVMFCTENINTALKTVTNNVGIYVVLISISHWKTYIHVVLIACIQHWQHENSTDNMHIIALTTREEYWQHTYSTDNIKTVLTTYI